MPTYPKDDLGNVRVDFAWGNVPPQPDELRTDNGYSFGGGNGDNGWGTAYQYSSDVLATNVYSTIGTPQVTVAVPNNHSLIKTGYQNFPEYIPNYAGDGDTGLETTVPKVTGLTQAAATTALTGAGLTVGTVSVVNAGATVKNEGKVATQSVAAGTIVNQGTAVNIGVYSTTVALPTNQAWFAFSASIILSNVLFADAPADVVANPANYNVVISGTVGGTYDGTYPVTAATTANAAGYSGDNHLALNVGWTHGYQSSADPAVGGTASIVHV